ncbi:MAG: 30S ribosomal protein S9 [Desulfurococcales archaeon]|nr:30S ribosomal protein S9 [Desulfurococcales archaeon]
MKTIITTGKRRSAIAVAIVKPGKGRVKVNGVPIELIPMEIARLKMMEPLLVAGRALRDLVDIDVRVRGGGFMGQADAVRMAITRGLLEFLKCENEESEDCEKRNKLAETLKRFFDEYDRTMLIGDPRKPESKKPMRYSARRRWQKSYR